MTSNDSFFDDDYESSEVLNGNKNAKRVKVYWKDMFEELINSYIEDKQTMMKNQILENAYISDKFNKEEVKLTSKVEIENYALKPKMNRQKLTKIQENNLLIIRYRIFKSLYEFGELYRTKLNLPSIQLDEHTLSGHHILGTIKIINIPLGNDNSLLMLKYFETQNYIDVLSSAESFKKTLNYLAKFSKLSHKNSEIASINEQNQEYIFNTHRCPKLYNVIIKWQDYCNLFDIVKLNVQKNGKVW